MVKLISSFFRSGSVAAVIYRDVMFDLYSRPFLAVMCLDIMIMNDNARVHGTRVENAVAYEAASNGIVSMFARLEPNIAFLGHTWETSFCSVQSSPKP
ncbi:hypothetical protein TNCT_658221 [Trichonephila clavata]|uniref:Uncharacterized protein n=1 Tax=Trichonephila clavata TaxID=2740835 RepID=A0A8X6H2K9_TRICU|nr:hypothetical protein TNCT_658221 [Trichonephila clavata]